MLKLGAIDRSVPRASTLIETRISWGRSGRQKQLQDDHRCGGVYGALCVDGLNISACLLRVRRLGDNSASYFCCFHDRVSRNGDLTLISNALSHALAVLAGLSPLSLAQYVEPSLISKSDCR